MNKAWDKAKKRENATGTRKARKPSQGTLEQLRKLRGECLALAHQTGNANLLLRAHSLVREIQKLEDAIMPVQPEADKPEAKKIRIIKLAPEPAPKGGYYWRFGHWTIFQR